MGDSLVQLMVRKSGKIWLFTRMATPDKLMNFMLILLRRVEKECKCDDNTHNNDEFTYGLSIDGEQSIS